MDALIASSLRHNTSHAPPEITPRPPSPLPGIRIHQTKRIPQPRFLMLCNIRAGGNEPRCRKRSPTGLIQIQLIRRRDTKSWEFHRGVGGGIGALGNSNRDRGIILGDEIAPDGHKRLFKIRSQVWCRRPTISTLITTVLGAGNRVLVFIAMSVVGCEGFGQPVGRADEGGFGVDVLSFVLALSSLRVSPYCHCYWKLTSARCCCPDPYELSLSAAGVLLPVVAKPGVVTPFEALLEG